MVDHNPIIGLQAFSDWRGHVHSIFDNAVNIQFQERLFTLLFNPDWISETNIILTDRQILSFITSSSQISFKNTKISIDDNSFPLENYSIWHMPELEDCAITEHALHALKYYIETHPGRFDGMFLNALKKNDYSSIIGLGHGLTPACDDMLTGFLLAIFSERGDLLSAFKQKYEPLLGQTTDISRHILQQALNGKFAFPLLKLLSALKTGSDYKTALHKAAQIGSSSGRDGIFGLYCGLQWVL